MGYFFNPCQIAEMAVQAEEAGIKFYHKAANIATDEKIKKIFLFLAEAEVEHREIIRTILETERWNDTEDEYAVDMAPMVRRLVEKCEKTVFDLDFVEKFPLAVGTCLDIGIFVENGFITLYTELLGTFAAKFHGILEKILSQEKAHLAMLQNTKKGLGLGV